MICLF